MHKDKGFSLIEVLLAITILIIFVPAFVQGIIYGRESTAVSGGISRATFIAEEGLEATRNIRDSSYANLIDGTYGLVISGNTWGFSGTSDVTDIFTRQIAISTIGTNRKQIVSTVTWQETLQRTGSVVLTTELTNWTR